jgi:glycosyltransferase involved in cell wall biosynthesis
MEVSVIITSYNQQSLLCEAIESVLEQTVTADEILIVDADSDDGSQEVIKEYEENNPSQVVSILLEDDPGIPKMRNRALKEVSGDYVAILDGDDRFLPQKATNPTESRGSRCLLKRIYY